jgi:hypothetical protein
MAISRLFLAALFLALTVSVANAYTIVMRDGRRVEIPNEFTVTNSTLTYEVNSGIQITIQLATIDVAATEQANNQPRGSLLLRASTPPKAVEPAVQPRPRAQRSITNKDLEVYARTRIQNEQDYEKQRKELGLPSAEERRNEVAAIEERTQEILRRRAQEMESEEYWRNREGLHRAEMAAMRAQLDFARRGLDEQAQAYSFGGYSTEVPFGTVGGPFFGFPFQGVLNPNIFGPSFGHSGFKSDFGFNTGFGFNRFNFGHRRFPFGGHRRTFVSPVRRSINPGRGHGGGHRRR